MLTNFYVYKKVHTFTTLTLVVHIIFVTFILVAAIDYENTFTMKMFRSTCTCVLLVSVIPVFPCWSSQPSQGSVAVPQQWSGRWCDHTLHIKDQ